MRGWRVGLPAMGGKRMAIRPRKMSELHILWVFEGCEMSWVMWTTVIAGDP